MKNEKRINNIKESVNKFAQYLEVKQLEVAGKTFSFLQAGLIISVVIELIACFLPFIERDASIGSVSLNDSINYFEGSYWDIITLLVMLVISCIFFFINQKRFCIFPAIYNLVKVVYDALFSGGDGRKYVTVCVGAYIMMIAALAVLVMTVLIFVNDNNCRYNDKISYERK